MTVFDIIKGIVKVIYLVTKSIMTYYLTLLYTYPLITIILTIITIVTWNW